MQEDGWFTFGYSAEGYLLSQFLVFFSALYILYIPQSLLGDYLEYSDLDINTSFNVDREKVEKRLIPLLQDDREPYQKLIMRV